MDFLSLEIKNKQVQQLSPQQILSNQILQMNNQQLQEYIARIEEENPAAEVDRSAELLDNNCSISSCVKDNYSGYLSDSSGIDGYLENIADSTDDFNTLQSYISYQLSERKISPEIRELCLIISEYLDENGYLRRESLSSLETFLANRVGTKKTDISNSLKKALAVIKSLDPPGMGAADLKECLLLQLSNLPETRVTSSAKVIVENCLDELAGSKLRLISEKLKLELDDIFAAREIILSLNPRPCSGFSGKAGTVYVTPDVEIEYSEDGISFSICDHKIPKLSVSSEYSRMLGETDSDDVKQYLRSKIHEVNQVNAGIKKRSLTLDQCMRSIIEIQGDYISGKTQKLKPLTMAVIAEMVGVHESTVSRCLKGKYVQCMRGCVPMNSFLSRSVGTSDIPCSAQEVKSCIREVIMCENGRALSDQNICDILKDRGICISRRTVAKYRKAMGIPTAFLRNNL